MKNMFSFQSRIVVIMILGICAIFGIVTAKENIPYGTGNWDSETLGNHRAVIHAEKDNDALYVHIPWRRRDTASKQREIIVVDSITNERLKNVVSIEINREYGDIAFGPGKEGRDYFIYYCPYSYKGSPYFPNTVYNLPTEMADSAWKTACGLDDTGIALGSYTQLPRAKVVEIQAASEMDSYYPMEVIATAGEMDELLKKYSSEKYLLYCEDRKFPIRMKYELPLRWIQSGPSTGFTGVAQPGEFYCFQIGVYASQQELQNLRLKFGDMESEVGKIPAEAITCFNLKGTDWLAREFKKAIDVQKGKVQALWVGVDIPFDVQKGQYRSRMEISFNNAPAKELDLVLTINGDILLDQGDRDLWRLSRLKWLNSTIGNDDEVFGDYEPVKVNGRTVSILGRQVNVGQNGFCEDIVNTYDDTVFSVNGPQEHILADAMKMVVETKNGTVEFKPEGLKFVKKGTGAVVWESRNKSKQFIMHCQAKMECDGYINYQITIQAQEDVVVEDIRLEIPYAIDTAKYMMGLGHKGGPRPATWQWKWDINLANHLVWLGKVSAGLQCKLKGEKDIWELYNLKNSGLPNSWDNEGQGGCVLYKEGDAFVFKAYSGKRDFKKGQEITYKFGLLITPLKLLDKSNWTDRYCHQDLPPQEVAAAGANIINIHHATNVNPFINYPFVKTKEFKSYIDEAHEKDIKVKVYYTVRELSNWAAELWAARSLDDEIYRYGEGFQLEDRFQNDSPPMGDVTTGNSWLCEHLVNEYVPAWHCRLGPGYWDAAIATQGLSRWHNYYLEGLNWLVKYLGVDGIYLDGVGYDREIMKRVRKVMDRAKPGCLIDYHCGNHFHKEYGLNNNTNQFMEHFPFVDRLWFGEGFNYDEGPDYWLLEISGIPLGLHGEMLGFGNPWRGMVYGMTNRYPYAGGDPRNMWKAWDEFGISDSQMYGYWSAKCPVQTNNNDVLATAYVKKDQTLVSIASWAKEVVEIKLLIDWKALGLDPDKSTFYAPNIENYQLEHLYKTEESIPVNPGRGWLLFIDEKE